MNTHNYIVKVEKKRSLENRPKTAYSWILKNYFVSSKIVNSLNYDAIIINLQNEI